MTRHLMKTYLKCKMIKQTNQLTTTTRMISSDKSKIIRTKTSRIILITTLPIKMLCKITLARPSQYLQTQMHICVASISLASNLEVIKHSSMRKTLSNKTRSKNCLKYPQLVNRKNLYLKQHFQSLAIITIFKGKTKLRLNVWIK